MDSSSLGGGNDPSPVEPSRKAASGDGALGRSTATLLRILTKVQADRRVARDFGPGEKLTMLEAELCAWIGALAGIKGSDLAEAFGVTHSAVSQMVSKLVKKGLITAETDSDNRRIKHLHLTASGVEVSEAIMRRYDDLVDRVFGPASDTELQHVARFLDRLEPFLEEYRTS